MKLHLRIPPQEIVQQYNLQDLFAANVYVYKGILGLKQASRLASNRLTKNLTRNGYAPVKHIPYLWCHHTSNLVFSLVVDNFGIECTRKEDADHLIKSLQENFNITKDSTEEK